MIFVILEWAMIALGVYAVTSQLIIPAINGTKLFPILSKARRGLSKKITELSELEQQLEQEIELANRVDALKEKIQQTTTPTTEATEETKP